MKLFSNKTLLIFLLIISGYGYFVSCTRDNDLIVPVQLTQPFVPNRGTNIHLPGNMTGGNRDEWKFDANHSSVLWSTPYRGASGLLTGRFNSFGVHDVTDAKMLLYDYNAADPTNGLTNPPQPPLLDSSWAFYENEPAKTYFNGYVQMNTSNTGEPNRDGSPYDPNIGCNRNTMGYPSIIPGKNNLTVTNLAKIKTTEVKFDASSNGYIVTLNLTWQGKLGAPLTKTITGYMKYIPKNRPTGLSYDVFGLQLKFQFNCRDFGIASTSISDKIDIECNINFNNN